MRSIKINTKHQLATEKLRLKRNLIMLQSDLESDMQIIKNDLKPMLSIAKNVSVAFDRNGQSTLEKSVRFGINLLVKGFLPGNAAWAVKKSVPFILNNVATNYVTEKKPEILGVIKYVLHRMKRKPPTKID